MSQVTRTLTPTDAALGAVFTYAWYAMPDVVHSRALRLLLKAGMSVAAITYILGRMPEGDWQGLRTLTRDSVADEKLTRGAVLGTLGVASAIGLAGESFIFRRGERRAWQGSAFPHSKQALVLGLLAAVGGLLPEVNIDLDDE